MAATRSRLPGKLRTEQVGRIRTLRAQLAQEGVESSRIQRAPIPRTRAEGSSHIAAMETPPLCEGLRGRVS
jgi:hypothetical protein